MCVGDGPNCRGKLQTCALDEDSCIVVVTETNRSKRAGAGITCWGGRGCLHGGRYRQALGETLSDDYIRKEGKAISGWVVDRESGGMTETTVAKDF